MAFVFRSPRNIDLPSSYSTNVSKHEEKSQSQNIQSEYKSGKLIQKKPYKITKHKAKVESQITTRNGKEFIQEVSRNQIKGSRPSKPRSINQQQFFFKSKCQRVEQIKPSQSEAQHENIKLVKKSKASKNKHQSQNFNNNKNPLQPIDQNKNKSLNKNCLEDLMNQKQQKFPCLMSKQVTNLNKSSNLLQSKRTIKQVFTVPSIPGKDQKYGYVLKQNQLSYPQMVSKPRFQGQRSDLPGPTDYQIPEKKKPKGVLKFQSSINRSIRNSTKNQTCALLDDQQALKLHNQKIRKWVQQGKQKNKKEKLSSHHQHKIKETCQTRDLSDCSDDSGLTVYEYDTTPGPGYYSYSCVKDKKNFRSKNQKFVKIFLNKSQRFQEVPVKVKQRRYEEFQQSTSTMSLHQNQKKSFFMSRLERKIVIQNESIAPPPGHYEARISMQNDIICKIIKNSPNLFNNNLPRLANTVNSITPGPGTYKLDPPNFKVQSFRTDSINDQNQLAKLQASYKACEKVLVDHLMRGNNTEIIHKIQDGIVQQSHPPPFLSSSPKDLNLNPKLDYITQPAKLEPLSPKTKQKQNMFPFNSSQIKGKQVLKNHAPGIGLYDNPQSWERKSFSVLFN